MIFVGKKEEEKKLEMSNSSFKIWHPLLLTLQFS